ncbi:hypothetical protein BN1221_03588c [Brenneria goodwinii]|uniref:Uncharacterized protein n=1 Tax=Brenneria goodwinii TaxID=1109412 RepID=A0A0G4JYZ3_9GAMM|nr:hypothetical protein BN1221_03588c [Brenneria goodwinii]
MVTIIIEYKNLQHLHKKDIYITILCVREMRADKRATAITQWRIRQ